MESSKRKQSQGSLDIPRLEKDIKEIFKLFDKDGDKMLSREELGQSLKSLGYRLTYKEVQLAMKHMDKNGNGKVEFEEFRDFIVARAEKLGSDKERQARQAFSIFDRDGNGFIDKRELRRAMESLGEQLTDAELDTMITEADENSDGKVDYEEFVKMVSQKYDD